MYQDEILSIVSYQILIYSLFGRKHVVFGKVVKGLEIVKKIEQVGTGDGKPAQPVKIIDCGEFSESKIQDGKEKGNLHELQQ